MEDETNVTVETPNDAETEETVETPEEVAPDATEGTETDTTQVEETDEAPELSREQLLALNKKLFTRAKTAEAKLKERGTVTPTKPAPAKPTPIVDVDERILLSQGHSPKLIKEWKDVAKVKGISLIEAQTHPLGVAVKESFDKAEKHKKASVGGSRGSGTPAPKKDFKTPNLSREEHMEMVKKLNA